MMMYILVNKYTICSWWWFFFFTLRVSFFINSPHQSVPCYLSAPCTCGCHGWACSMRCRNCRDGSDLFKLLLVYWITVDICASVYWFVFSPNVHPVITQKIQLLSGGTPLGAIACIQLHCVHGAEVTCVTDHSVSMHRTQTRRIWRGAEGTINDNIYKTIHLSVAGFSHWYVHIGLLPGSCHYCLLYRVNMQTGTCGFHDLHTCSGSVMCRVLKEQQNL